LSSPKSLFKALEAQKGRLKPWNTRQGWLQIPQIPNKDISNEGVLTSLDLIDAD